MRAPRPRARAWKRFSTRALPTKASETTRSSTSRSWLFSALAIALSRHFLTSLAMRLRENSRSASAVVDLLAADELRHEVELLRADAQHARDGLSLVVGQRAGSGLLAHAQLLFAFLSAAWPWKVRVGENSPNLWPTMSSET